jgi:hypothetical protein
LHAVHQSNHHHWTLAEARQQQIDEMLGSTSFRVTAPMRAVAKRLRALADAPSRAMLRAKIWLKPHVASFLANSGVRGSVAKTARWTLAHPRLAGPIKDFIGRHPRLSLRLRRFILGQDGFGPLAASAPLAHAEAPATPGMAGFDQPGGALATVLTKCAPSAGIHADQRGPLEASYWSYLSDR